MFIVPYPDALLCTRTWVSSPTPLAPASPLEPFHLRLTDDAYALDVPQNLQALERTN